MQSNAFTIFLNMGGLGHGNGYHLKNSTCSVKMAMNVSVCMHFSYICSWFIEFNFVLCYFRYKFDDERVTKEDVKRALEEQYGGEEEVFSFAFSYFEILNSFQCISCEQIFCRVLCQTDAAD